MGWEGWGVVISAIGLLLTIMAVVYNAGRFTSSFAALKEWFERENTRNSNQHIEFYKVKEDFTTLKADHGNTERRLENIEAMLQTVVHDIGEISKNMPRRRSS